MPLTEDFCDAVRKHFAGCEEVMQWLERGGIPLGHALYRAVQQAEEDLPREIIRLAHLCPSETVRARVREAAVKVQAKRALFNQWSALLEKELS